MPVSLWSASTDVRSRDHRLEHVRRATRAAEAPVPPFQRPRPALVLGVFFLCLYLLTMGGHLDSPDEELMLQVTRSLAERGSMDVSGTGVAERLTVTGADGRTYVPYSPVASALGVPFYKVGQALNAILPGRYSEVATRFAVGVRDSFISAMACVVLYALALELGYGATVAVLLTLAFGTATLAWPFSKYSFSEPVTGLFLLLSVFAAVRTARSARPAWSALCGIALGLAIGSKATAAFAAPAVLVYLVGAGSAPLLTRVRRVVPCVVMLAVPAVGLALVNAARFGNPLDTGYHIDGLIDFANPIGIAGLLVSPSKSLFVYAPVALLGLVGLVRLVTRSPWEAGLLFWLVASQVVFHGLLAIWPGDAGWGPRYLVPIVPFIVVPAGAVLTWTHGIGARLYWTWFSALFGLGVLVNLGGVLVDQRVSFVKLLNEADGNFSVMDEHRWEPGLSPVLIHWQEVLKRYANLLQSWSQPVSMVSGTYGKEAIEPVDAEAAPRSDLFPRWTSGAAVFELKNHGQPAELTLEYLDNRPSSLGPAVVQIVVNGSPLPEANITRTRSDVPLPDKRRPWFIQARLDDAVIGQDAASVEIRSQTWHAPPDVRDLGIQIWDLRFRSTGQDLAMGEALFSPMPVTDALPWSYELETWFYMPPWHLADVWLWYLYLSGLPRSFMLIALAPAAGLLWAARHVWGLLRHPS
jgi:hypothetical protein